nr:hypothetical protein [Mycoplasmoides gallisepticum]
MNSGLTLFDEETKGSKAGKIFLALISLESTNEEFKWLNTATAEGSDKSSIENYSIKYIEILSFV